MPYVGRAMDRRRSRRIAEALAREADLRPLSVQCHACGRLAGLDCQTASGAATRPHRARQILALVITRDVTLGRLAPRSGVTNHEQPCTCSHCTGVRLAQMRRA